MAVNATPATADEFAERLFGAALGMVDMLAVFLGDRLGWYQALADGGPATAEELVSRAGGAPRYAQEWLEQQACTGILTVGEDGRFALAEGAAEILTDPTSLSFLAPLARMFGAAAVQMPALLEAYRTGGGVSWERFGVDMRESQADMNRPWFEHRLADALAAVSEIDAVLRRPGARIADVGCGGGWSSIALARAYPEATVDGYDVDAPSVELASANAASAGLDGRVAFHRVDGASLGAGDGPGYDAIFAFECIHDMPRPVEVLAGMRRALAPDGVAVIMDEAVAETFAPPGDDTERLMYGFSLFICLPDGLSSQPSAGTGTVMRRAVLDRYAREAGFQGADVLPIDDFGFWRFYRLPT